MRYKHVLFDLDGTLTDPGVGITKSVQYALQKLGIEEDREQLYSFIGPPLQLSFAERYGMSESQSTEAIRLYREYFAETGIYENELYEGMQELLETLKRSEAVLHVATSKPTEFAQRILSHFGIAAYFESVTGSFLDGRRTDKTEIIRHVLTSHCIAKEDTVMIGDRKHDLIGAANNGIASVGVSYGYGSEEELKACSPSIIVQSVASLEAWLTFSGTMKQAL
ncbi:HAD-superfamily hydrolase, subfamily IA, variant 1 [Paenibacillus curdlanolyticus YK9]|uniref:HAD-superfamily hydrolase, subfamily IA, variant 1 n=1 Tax=Paenibacillus curdlanolyticus YK9 TaxID=717606 RepID=E0IGA9_9BACL|nr:HAD family hydrolase [Paenibacillus curdlanolyticus]EFM08511.1 HAD-superfamily hydrolase, subfamily IA, variant 1 [Paenibacillus curdlanolyticus YK9]